MVVSLIAEIEGTPEAAMEVELAVVRSVAASRKEEGCQYYVAHRDVDRVGRFVLIERWASVSMLEAHGERAHTRDFVSALRKLGAEVRVTRLEPMG